MLKVKIYIYIKLTGAKRREFSGMIHWLTINNHPNNPQQPPATPSNPSIPYVQHQKVIA